jgi:vacuolar-type H+-ATPase subunit D/Vma8
MKSKLKGAQVGHDLLKRKSEALTKYVNPSWHITCTNMILSQTVQRYPTQ